MSNDKIIHFDHIGMQFGRTTVHRDINFSITHGETLTILGPSGTGKTVLFKLIIGLLYPTSGKVMAYGKDTATMNDDDLLALRMKVGILFQGAALFDSLSVYENIAYPLREHGETSETKINTIVKERLELVGLENVIKKFPSELSGGQKKRVGLARALASSPEVMLFDEPTTGLDPTAVRLIDDLIIRLREELGITSLVITHDIASAKRISTRWVFISGGYVVADGEPQMLVAQNESVEKFTTGFSLD